MTIKLILIAALGLIVLVSARAAAEKPEVLQLATLTLDRTDVPWQATRTVDPDNVRAF